MTNGITWVRGLQLQIVVIPEFIYLIGGEFDCLEGGSEQLSSSLFSVENEYYRGKITEYKIVRKPKHGVLFISKYSDAPLNKFTKQQYENGVVRVI